MVRQAEHRLQLYTPRSAGDRLFVGPALFYARLPGWPFRRRRLYNSESSELVYIARGIPRWVADPSQFYLWQVLDHTVETLFRSEAGRFFLLRSGCRVGTHIRALWRWQARSWLFEVGAPRDVVETYFPRSFTKG
jgi:hypothetical protein